MVLLQWLNVKIAKYFNRNILLPPDLNTDIVIKNFNLVIFSVFFDSKIHFVNNYKPFNGKLVKGTNNVLNVLDVLLFIFGIKLNYISKINCDKAFL